ncbi:hypothetical protein ATO10_06456 [Actibacterium atlanticum]|uniref:Polyketide cyclase/dehydrase n=1 Tax=Actibacterium atlanticum TaxID=1461693 RepID=A0A058ZN01_9RHOB|nr:hypothetical protein [Actibacterium atlanticum]KCV82562.1 hypothetical protein ATO10_06456 [Actibacterium atlanticum]
MSRQVLVRLGIVTLYGLIQYAISFFMFDHPAATISAVALYGIGLGLACQLVFDWKLLLPLRTVIERTVVAILVVSALLILLRFETLICVVIALPFAAGLATFGIALTRAILKALDPTHLNVSILIVLPMVLPVFDWALPTKTELVRVSNSIVVDAPASDIRRLAENVAPITQMERPWTVTHDLLRAPRPVSAQTIDGVRYATWTNGVHFEEHLLNGPDLAWRFVFPDPDALKAVDTRISPTGPEVSLIEGRYSFEPLGSSRTRVTLTTTYQLATPINAYLKPWGKLFLGDFHVAVLTTIADRAEARHKVVMRDPPQ